MAYLFLGLTIIFTVGGQVLLKWGMNDVGPAPGDVALVEYTVRALLTPKVILGLVSAVLAIISWMITLSRVDINFAYPFMGLAVVLTLALAQLVLGEHVPLQRWVGVGIVCIGLTVAAQ